MSFHFDDVMHPTRTATQEEILELRSKYDTSSTEAFNDEEKKTFNFSKEMSFGSAEDNSLSRDFTVSASSETVSFLEYEPIIVGESDVYVADYSEGMVA